MKSKYHCFCLSIIFCFIFLSSLHAQYATGPRFKALIYYTKNAEGDHVAFAEQGVAFFNKLSSAGSFILDVTTDLSDYPYEKLKGYDIVIMFNSSPAASEQRDAFRKYMENGGGWIGFHGAAYNSKNTQWPWFVDFLGGGVFYRNSWPAQPAKLIVDNLNHPVTKNLPASFIAPANEWYQWNPSPRENKNVDVLVSLSPDNYPIGIKDVVDSGDYPVVWTNRNYRMIYLNMGHGDEIFSDATQKLLIINAFRWVLSMDKKGDPFKVQRNLTVSE